MTQPFTRQTPLRHSDLSDFQILPSQPDTLPVVMPDTQRPLLAGEWEPLNADMATLPVIDLNQLYAVKCHGARPWRGSVLCNLGDGGALGQLIVSLRLTRGKNGYSTNGLVTQVMLAFSGLKELLTAQPNDPWYSQAVLAVANRLGATQAFLRVYDQLTQAISRNEHVDWSNFDELTAYAVSLLEIPIIRNALRVYLTDELNLTLLDLGAVTEAGERGWADQFMGWMFNRVPGLVEPEFADPEPEVPESLPVWQGAPTDSQYFDAADYPEPEAVGLGEWEQMA
jgi:hypothetical protein